MQNRITAKISELANKSECALVCYVVAGYPDAKTTQEAIDALVAGGADMVEVGIPFSDPIADGPTVQAASNIALENGMTPEKALQLVKNIRKHYPALPLLVMTYCNILVRVGIEKFMMLAKEHGIDGFILPDLSIEESEEYSHVASKLGMSLVFLVSPNTAEARLKKIAESTSGFLYLVSVYGITGARKSVEDYTLDAIKNAKRFAGEVPVAVGFGISRPAHAKLMINTGADALIIGSAIVDKISKWRNNKKRMLNELYQFAHSMKMACKKKQKTH
jgi:tryptophan synthase alpha chain